MRKNRAVIKRLIPEARLACPRRSGRAVERDERADWEVLDENFHLVAGLERYRTLDSLHGQLADGKDVTIFDLQARGRVWSCILVNDLDLPNFRLYPSPEEDAGGELTTGDEAFDRRFAVWAEDGPAGEMLFTEAVRSHLLRGPRPDLAVEAKNGFLLASCYSLAVDEYRPVFRHVAALVGLLDDAVQQILAA